MSISLKAYLNKIQVSDAKPTAKVGKVYEAPPRSDPAPALDSPKKVITYLTEMEKKKMKLRTEKAMLSNQLVDSVIMEEEELKKAKYGKFGQLEIDKIEETHVKKRAEIYRQIVRKETEERDLGRKMKYTKVNHKLPQENEMRNAKKRPAIDETNLYKIEKEIQTLSSERSACKRRIPDRPDDDPKKREWIKKVSEYNVRIDELRKIKEKLLENVEAW